VLKVLGGRTGYRGFVLDGIEDGHKEEYYEVEDQRFLGPQGFGEQLTSLVGEEKYLPRTKKPLGTSLGVLAARLE
jgi:hypothetical protein